MSPRFLLAALGAVLLFTAGCGGDSGGCEGEACKPAAVCGNGTQEAGEQCDDGNTTGGDGCEANCTSSPVACGNRRLEEGEVCDDGNTAGGDGCEADCKTLTPTEFTRCAASTVPPPASGATCEVTKAGNGARLFTGVVLKDGETLLGGQVLVDAAGIIQCAACDCSGVAGAAEATAISCPAGVISPGLINPHEHITYDDKPYVGTDERYEHRNEWRTGANGHTAIRNGGANGGADPVGYAELRHVMAGTTSIAGAGGAPGLLRNLDVSTVARQEGLNEGYADSDTFPLGDNGGDILTDGCGYPSRPSQTSLPKLAAYLPHVAEGIGHGSANEFRCLSSGPSDVLLPRTAIIHGIALAAKDIAVMAERGTGLIWSPRSNIALYGDTAMVPAFQRMGVSVALGTDWLQSGSMNLLRELQCADYLNATHYAKALSDEQLWRMVTANAADVTDTFEKVGRLVPGKVGDLAIFRLRSFFGSPHRAVITANPQDVVLTLRGGKPLYGDGALVDALNGSDACDTLDVCGTAKAACLQSEVGKNLAALQAANASAYPLFACGTPENEPTCSPRRTSTNPEWPASRNGSTVYTSELRADDSDGDGVPNDTDNCPSIFNPVRPMDDGAQADSDADGQGDACDVCPTAAGATSCLAASGADDDGDGVATWADNCPFLANPDQTDADSDGKGDACDGCPQQAGGTCATPDPVDSDVDGIEDAADNCDFAPNPAQEDADSDGQGDACDPCAIPNPNGAACPTTVYDLKTPVSGGNPLEGYKVAVSDVLVTAVNASGTNGYFVQVHPPPQGRGVEYSGIYVYGPKAEVAVGDRLDITEAKFSLFRGVLELSEVKLTKLSSGNALPAPVRVRSEEVRTGGPRAAALDALLVELRDLTITRGEDRFKEFVVDENPSGDPAQSGLLVDDLLYVYPEQTAGNQFRLLRGVLTFSFGNYKVLPRGAGDMLPPLPPLPALTGFAGGPYVRVGSSTGAAFPQQLVVAMASAFPEDVTVTITSSNPEALGVVGGGVTVPAGQTTAQVTLEPRAAALEVTLTATLGGSSRETTLRVLGSDEQALISRLDPASTVLVPGGTATFTLQLDRPAPAGTSVALSVDPAAGLGTFGVQDGVLVVEEDALQAVFTFTADAEPTVASGTVTARLGDSHAEATVTVDPDAPRLVSLQPSPEVTVPAGGTQVFTVTVDQAPVADVQVALAIVRGPNVTRFGAVPDTVTLAAGSTEATFTFTADAEGEGQGTVSASLFGLTGSSAVTVTPPPPKLSALSPDTATVPVGGTFTFEVTLDRPAQTETTEVELSLSPAEGVGSVPARVPVPLGSRSATFTFTAAQLTAGAQAVLTARFGGVEDTSQVDVVVAPGTGLVINEVDYDMPGAGDSLEFVEVFNPTSASVPLRGVFLVLANGNNGQSYRKLELTSVGSLGAGEYLVIGSDNVIVPLSSTRGVKTLALKTSGGSNENLIENGAPDAVGLYSSDQDALIDSLSYEGNVAGATITGSTKTFDFREGDEDTAGLADTGDGSLSRDPQSTDSGNNAVDFRLVPTSTPGAVNAAPAP